MKKIAFYDNGPGHKFENIYTGGDIAEVEDNVAEAYIGAKLAFEIKNKVDENKAQGIKAQVQLNEERRKLVPKANLEKIKELREQVKETGVTVI